MSRDIGAHAVVILGAVNAVLFAYLLLVFARAVFG